MANVNVGVVGQAELNGGMLNNSNGSKSIHMTGAAGWTYVWFIAAVAFILFVYFGFGGHRGAVAS